MIKRYGIVFCLVLTVSVVVFGDLRWGSSSTNDVSPALLPRRGGDEVTLQESKERSAEASVHDGMNSGEIMSIRTLETEVRALGYIERINSGEATAEERARFAVVAKELTRLRAQKIALELAALESEIRDQAQKLNEE